MPFVGVRKKKRKGECSEGIVDGGKRRKDGEEKDDPSKEGKKRKKKKEKRKKKENHSLSARSLMKESAPSGKCLAFTISTLTVGMVTRR